MILIASSVLPIALTANLGVPLVRASEITKYDLAGLQPAFPTSGIPTGLVARDGYVYFPYQTSTAGIGRLDPATTTVKLYNLPSEAGTSVIAFDLGEANAWILTEDGVGARYLYELNLSNGATVNWRVGSDTNGLLVENDSSIWLTGPTLDRFNANTGEMKSYVLPCFANRCWTNSTNVFRPIWANGKLWALLMYAIPLPFYVGEALMQFDPHSGKMTVYSIPPFFHNGQLLDQSANDLTSNGHGDLWLMLDSGPAKFDVAARKYELIQSTFGPIFTGPAVCDKEGNLFFVQRNYTQSLIEYSPSSQAFTNYWTGPSPPAGIQDLVVDSNDIVWFLNTYYNETSASFEDLYSLSVGGAGTTILTTVSINTSHTSVSAIPSGFLIYTGSVASTTERAISTVAVNQSTSTLVEASTIIATETLAVNELEAPAAVTIAALVLVTMWVTLGRTAKRRH